VENREFYYSLLRATIMRAKSVDFFNMLSNEKSITAIIRRCQYWKQWAMDWPNWVLGTVDHRFEKLWSRSGKMR
jgi:hypothetical protein